MSGFEFTDDFYKMIMAGELKIVTGSDNAHYMKDLDFVIEQRKGCHDVRVFQGNRIIATMTVKDHGGALHLCGVAMRISLTHEIMEKLEE